MGMSSDLRTTTWELIKKKKRETKRRRGGEEAWIGGKHSVV